VTLAVARGVPMLTAGDEMGRTQRGNNNAYCLDDETSWLDWTLDDGRRALFAFTRRLLGLRAELPVLHEDAFLPAAPEAGAPAWWLPEGTPVTKDDWRRRALQVVLPAVRGPSLLLLLNADAEDRRFTLPAGAGAWVVRVDTRAAEAPPPTPRAPGATYELVARSCAVLVGA
jgi:glycogen operon protein